jgi:hypothetical protein
MPASNGKDAKKATSASAKKIKDLPVRKSDADKVKGGAIMGGENPPLR